MEGGLAGLVAWSDWPGALTEPRSARVVRNGRATEMVAALEDQNQKITMKVLYTL